MHASMLSHFTHVQLFETLWPGSFVYGVLQARILEGVGCHALLQGIFPSQGSNPHFLQLLLCRQILYHWATGEALLSLTKTKVIVWMSPCRCRARKMVWLSQGVSETVKKEGPQQRGAHGSSSEGCCHLTPATWECGDAGITRHETSLATQLVKASSAGGVGLIPGWGARIPHALRPKHQNIKQKQYCNKFNKDLKNWKIVHIKKKKKRKEYPDIGTFQDKFHIWILMEKSWQFK